MPEIRTCEEYVLSQLFTAEEENFELRKTVEQNELEIAYLRDELKKANDTINVLKKYAKQDNLLNYLEENFNFLK